jgi:hypothetical protein
MDLFDLIKSVFKSDEDWKKVPRNIKIKHFFMVNRIMSIQFPMHAHLFNHSKIETIAVVDWWHSFLGGKFKKPPAWIFTTGPKKNPNLEVEKNPDIEEFIRNKYGLSSRDLKQLHSFYPESYIQWINSISDQLGGNKKQSDI